MYMKPMPRPGPVPISVPTVPASGPSWASSGSNTAVPYGATRPKPIGRVDQATSVFSAITRPWNRWGTLTWMIVA